MALFKDIKFGEAWKPVEDEYYEEEERADCEEATDEEKKLAGIAN